MIRKNIIITLVVGTIFLLVPLTFVGVPVGLRYAKDLDDPIEAIKLRKYETMPLATEVFDRQGRKVGEFNSEKRFYLKIDKIPKHVIQAFVSAEDKDFYQHHGISLSSMVRSVFANIRGRRLKQGASTITQQVARMWFLSREKTFERKIKEVVLALVMEQNLSKDEILEMYLNKIYLGNHSFGVEAASRNYFRKSATEVSIGEAAMLAGLPQSPSRYAPNRHRKAASKRQAFVLNRLVEDGVISKKDAADWKKFKLPVAKRPENHLDKAPYFVSAVKEEMLTRFESQNLPESGLKITTTLDYDLQKAADEKLHEAVENIKKHAINDFRHKSTIEGSIISLDPRTGAVLAIQGGEDFSSSQFNRAFYARRQVGGMFVPVYVALALERGFNVTSLVGDDPMGGKHYKKNSGRMSLYDLMTRGKAMDGAPLYVSLGSGSVQDFAEKLGFNFKREDLSLALGFGEASSEELAQAYAPFINGGFPVQPFLIQKIENADGKVLYDAGKVTLEPESRVMSEQTAFMMYHMMREAVQTGQADMASGVSLLAGGISSATDDLHNAWFVGVTPSIVSAVWIGAERGRTRLGKTSDSVSDIAETVWREYMTAAPTEYLGNSLMIDLPKGISFSRVRTNSGKVTSLPFLMGREPTGRSKSF